jgi:hypothetical protein
MPNPTPLLLEVEVGRGDDKCTEIFVVGGAKITVRAIADDAKRNSERALASLRGHSSRKLASR